MSSIGKFAEQAGAKAPAKAQKLKCFEVVYHIEIGCNVIIEAKSKRHAEKLAHQAIDENDIIAGSDYCHREWHIISVEKSDEVQS